MCPIFIFPCGGRTGSTWLGRLLTSSNEVLVWAETNLLQCRFNYLNSVRWTFKEDTGKDNDLHYFRKHGTTMWSAMLRPFEEDLNVGWAAMMDKTFQTAAEREGFRRWGLKEVSWNLEDVLFVRKHWNDCRVIFLIRNFLDCYRSATGTGWLLGETGRIGFIREWLRMANQIHILGTNDKERIFRYENIDVEDLKNWCGLSKLEKQEYVGSSSKYLSAYDWDILRPFIPGINDVLGKFGYSSISSESLLDLERDVIKY